VPYFGSGVDNSVNLTPVPTLVFTPNPGANSTVRMVNQGTSNVYVGGPNVSALSGLLVAPAGRVELPVMNAKVYASGGYNPSTLSATTVSSALTAGTTAFTVGSATGLSTGATLMIGNTPGQEFVTVAGFATTSVTAATGLLQDHASGAAVAFVNPVIGLLRVGGGTSGVA
jgi:hypothetical protein